MRPALILAGIPLIAMVPTMLTAKTTPDAAPIADETTNKRFSYPNTKRENVVDTQFGVKVADPYRWLENDVRVDPSVKHWVDAENAVTNAYLQTLPGRDILKSRMEKLLDFARFDVPRKAGNRYFYTRNDGLQNQSVLYVQDGLAAERRVLIDPNSWAKDGATALAEWKASGDGQKLVYAVQDGGSDWRTVRVLDVASGKMLPDEVKWVKYSNLDWAKDGSGFYYSRFDAPAEGEAFQSLSTNQQVYFHKVGTPQSADILVYRTPDRPDLGHTAEVTDDGRYLVITSSQGTDARYEVNILDLTQKNAKPLTLIAGLDNNWELVGNRNSSFYFVTDKDAPRQRIVMLDIVKPKAAPVEIVTQNDATLTSAALIGEKIVLSYLRDAKSEAKLVALDGKPVGEVKLPGIGTAIGFRGKAGDNETFYSFSSFAVPPTVYRLDTASGETSVFAQPKVAFDPAQYETLQRFYASNDGTKVPLFIVRKKGASPSGGAPTLLYGYGGFQISVTPSFSATRLAWLEQGGVLAIANLRGGGEYGKEWHDAGRLQNKQNVFDDLIAAGEYLIATGITGKGQLAVEGRSNGGLLVGAVVNQRPDLFAAALPAVGVMDMTRFDRWTAGRYWVDDYGYPSKEADFRKLYSYSPYHNVKSGTDYPAILVTTADTDDRVVPGHSFKYTAALQAADIGNKPHLIRIETRAGHGSGKPTDKIIEESADMYAFIAKWTGLTIAGPR